MSVGREVTRLIQVFRCNVCGKCWSKRQQTIRRKWSRRLILEAVKAYIQGSGSLRVLSKNIKANHQTLHEWIIQFGKNTKDPIEFAISLGLHQSNKWSGILFLDGKWLGKNLVLLLAVDVKTLDIVAWRVCEAETEANYTKLIDLVESCGYMVKAIISDGEPAILSLTQLKLSRARKGTRPFPRPGIQPKVCQTARLEGVPHQWCLIHARWRLKTLLNRCSKPIRGNIWFWVMKILFARRESTAQGYLIKLLELTDPLNKQQKTIANFLIIHWGLLMTHHRIRIDGRRIPRDTNGIENVISYLNTRFKQCGD